MHNGISEEIANNTKDYKDGYLKGIQDSQTKKERNIDILKSKEHQTKFQKRLLDTYGNFCFSFYKRFMNMDKKYLFRFVYLCTYMNYDNYLANKRELIHYEELNNYLNLNRTDFYDTVKYLKENEYIYINEKKQILINEKYCKKGQISVNKKVEFIRTFDEAIRNIYKDSTSKEHKKLSLLIKILPYINFNYNIICHNPSEEILENIEIINLKELSEILGYGKTNTNRLKNDLFKLRVNGELVIGIWEDDYGKVICVNSRLFYKGNEEDDLFKLHKRFSGSSI